MKQEQNEEIEPLPTELMTLSQNVEPPNNDKAPKKRNNTGRKNCNVSDDLRKRLIDALENGICTRRTAALMFGISYPSVLSIYGRFLKTGAIEKGKRNLFRPKKLNAEQMQFLSDTITANRCCTLKELQSMLRERYGVQISMTSISLYARRIPSNDKDREGINKLQKLNKHHIQFLFDLLKENCSITLKDLRAQLLERYGIQVSIATMNKTITGFHFTIKRMKIDVKAVITQKRTVERNIFCKNILTFINHGRTLIFVEETIFQITVRKLTGLVHARQNPKLITPSLPTRNKTIMVAMTKKELIFYRAEDGLGDHLHFLLFLNDFIGELYTQGINNTVIIMDKASSFNCQQFRGSIREAGHELLLMPPYSPSYNPVEILFTQWPSIIRSKKIGDDAEFEEAISTFARLVSTEQCHQFWKLAVDNIISSLTENVQF